MRSLCLLLGKEPLPGGINYLKLTKPVDDPRKLDAYTMNHFANSEEVRQHFKEQIDNYLKNNQLILLQMNEKTKKNYRGSIVIIEENKESVRKLRTLYSSTINTVKEMLNDRRFIMILAKDDEECKAKYLKLFSNYEIDSILAKEGLGLTHKELKQLLILWKENLKTQYHGTDKLRKVLKKYENYKKQIRKRDKEYKLK